MNSADGRRAQARHAPHLSPRSETGGGVEPGKPEARPEGEKDDGVAAETGGDEEPGGNG